MRIEKPVFESVPLVAVKTRTSWWPAGQREVAFNAVMMLLLRFPPESPRTVATAVLGVNGTSMHRRPVPSLTIDTFLLAARLPSALTYAQARTCWVWSARLLAVSAVLALLTERPGASLLTWFLAMFFACFLVTNAAPIAVPPSAAISATMATTIAGDGRRNTLFIFPPSSAGRNPPGQSSRPPLVGGPVSKATLS